MKKILAIILASLMLISLVACGNGNNEETTDAPVNNEETTVSGNNNETTEGGNNGDVVEGNVIVPTVSDDTWGYAIWNVFSDLVKNNPEMSTGEIVYNILMNEVGQPLGFCDSMDMPEGYLPGFSEDITGFKSATVFTPMASGNPFMGYVFELEDTSSVNSFMQTLNEKHDLRWMVCMTAEMATMGAYENYVLFVMSPVYMPGVGGANAVINYPETAEDGTYAAEIWNFFEQAMGENPTAGAEEMAYAVAYSPVVPFNMSEVTSLEIAANDHFTLGLDGAEAVFSVTEEGSDMIIYVITIELGLDAFNWSSYYVTGEGVVWGSYDSNIIVMYGANDYIQ